MSRVKKSVNPKNICNVDQTTLTVTGQVFKSHIHEPLKVKKKKKKKKKKRWGGRDTFCL
jgi:hypothetical protein